MSKTFKFLETDQELITMYNEYSQTIRELARTGVKEYTIGDRTFQKQDMIMLKRLQNDVITEIKQREAGSGVRLQRVLPIPRI